MRLLITVAVFVWAGATPLAAQRRSRASAPRVTRPPRPLNAGGGRQNPNRENPAKELERFQKMPPEDREKALSKLSPARRARVEQQLQRFDSMPPAQRERQLQRLEQFQNLAPERRAVVRQEIQDLRSLPPPLRKDRLNGEELNQFTPDEQELIRGSFPRLTQKQPQP